MSRTDDRALPIEEQVREIEQTEDQLATAVEAIGHKKAHLKEEVIGAAQVKADALLKKAEEKKDEVVAGLAEKLPTGEEIRSAAARLVGAAASSTEQAGHRVAGATADLGRRAAHSANAAAAELAGLAGHKGLPEAGAAARHDIAEAPAAARNRVAGAPGLEPSTNPSHDHQAKSEGGTHAG